MFGQEHQEGSGFVNPFLFSFCTHSSHLEYAARNGLLSQWRAYGTGEGVSIVFDTKALVEQLFQEADEYLYTPMGIGSVIYSHQIEQIENTFHSLFDRISKMMVDYYEGGGDQDFGEIYGPYASAACRLKHEAFFEEQEVRIYAAPIPARNFSRQSKPYPIKHQKSKEILKLNDGREYIKLLSNKKFQLPITKIIVGPSKDQQKISEEIKHFVSNNIEIIQSQTPLVIR